MVHNRARSDARIPWSRRAIYALVIAVIGGFVAIVFWQAKGLVRSGDASPARALIDRGKVERRLQAEAFRLSQQLPKQIDEKTTLARVSTSGRQVTYHYHIIATRDEEGVVRKFTENSVLPHTCRGTLREDLFTRGVTYTFRYESEEFSNPVIVTVNEEACRKHPPKQPRVGLTKASRFAGTRYAA